MSILIKGMEMPTSCWRCSLSQLYDSPRERLVCKVTHEEVLRHKIDGNCPIIPVPDHVGGVPITDFRLVPSNADSIRAMSDEDLAELLAMACPVGFRCNAVEPYEDESAEHHCARCLLPWLKSPAEKGVSDV